LSEALNTGTPDLKLIWALQGPVKVLPAMRDSAAGCHRISNRTLLRGAVSATSLRNEARLYDRPSWACNSLFAAISVPARAGTGTAAGRHRCDDAILQHPEAGPIVRVIVRRRLCRRLPYALLYSIREDHIRILAVMNLKRRPAYWIGRS
jgi:hypothetical protein